MRWERLICSLSQAAVANRRRTRPVVEWFGEAPLRPSVVLRVQPVAAVANVINLELDSSKSSDASGSGDVGGSQDGFEDE